MPLHSDSGEVAVFVVDGLPKLRSEVNSGENCRVGSTDVTDVLIHFRHRVFVGVCLFVESSEVLDDAQATTPPPFLESRKIGEL